MVTAGGIALNRFSIKLACFDTEVFLYRGNSREGVVYLFSVVRMVADNFFKTSQAILDVRQFALNISDVCTDFRKPLGHFSTYIINLSS